MAALVEAHELHLAPERQIELEEPDAVAHQQLLEVGRIAQEVCDLVLRCRSP